jgi:hypothetical protein
MSESPLWEQQEICLTWRLKNLWRNLTNKIVITEMFCSQVKAISDGQLVTWWIVRGCTDRWWLQAYFHLWLQQSEGICQYAISHRCTQSSRVIQWTKVQQITPQHYASWVTAFLFHYLMQSLTGCKSIGSCEKVWLVAVRIVPSWIVFLPWVVSFVVLLHGLMWPQVLLPLPGSLSIVCARLLCGQVWDKWQIMGLRRWAMSSSHVCRHIPERIELPCRQY